MKRLIFFRLVLKLNDKFKFKLPFKAQNNVSPNTTHLCLKNMHKDEIIFFRLEMRKLCIW